MVRLAQSHLFGFNEEDSGFHHTPGGTLLESLGHRDVIRSHRFGQVEQVIILPGDHHQFLTCRKMDFHLASKLPGHLLPGTGGKENAEDCSENQNEFFHIGFGLVTLSHK